MSIEKKIDKDAISLDIVSSEDLILKTPFDLEKEIKEEKSKYFGLSLQQVLRIKMLQIRYSKFHPVILSFGLRVSIPNEVTMKLVEKISNKYSNFIKKRLEEHYLECPNCSGSIDLRSITPDVVTPEIYPLTYIDSSILISGVTKYIKIINNKVYLHCFHPIKSFSEPIPSNRNRTTLLM